MVYETGDVDSRDSGKLKNIAISLSGGGVRAVGFHLGMLEMLERLELLEKVTILSTVSGGSLTGTGYALAQLSGQSFNEFFGNFYEFLPNLNALEKFLQGLSSSDYPSPSGRRDMITVLANIYDDAYFKKYFNQLGVSGSPRFGEFWRDERKGHLREIIFNATEFQTGKAFRFQKSEFRCLIGNASISLCERHARQIRMADIMAASSCIPVGMEPMFFPDDFHWPDDEGAGAKATRPTCNEVKSQLRENLRKRFRLHQDSEIDFFALMDGGVYDNQGIVSLLLAMNRIVTEIEPEPPGQCDCGKNLYEGREEPGPDDWARWLAGKTQLGAEEYGELEGVGWEQVDLLIISDTPVRKDSLYPKLAEPENSNDPETAINLIPALHKDGEHSLLYRLTVGRVDNILFLLTMLLLASITLTVYDELIDTPDFSSWTSIVNEVVQIGISLALTSGLAIGLFILRRKLRDISSKLYALLPRDRWGDKEPWAYVKKLRLLDLFDMVSLRMGSVSSLTASIFMNRIRSLSYSAAYSREDLDEHVMTNQIFALENLTDGCPSGWPQDWPDSIKGLTEEASAIVTLAAHMQTKLWINRLDKGIDDYEETLAASGRVPDATRTVLAMNRRRVANGQPAFTDLDVLVICGQLTTCYKLMLHTWREPRNTEVFDKACELWARLHDDPAALVDERRLWAEDEATAAA